MVVDISAIASSSSSSKGFLVKDPVERFAVAKDTERCEDFKRYQKRCAVRKDTRRGAWLQKIPREVRRFQKVNAKSLSRPTRSRHHYYFCHPRRHCLDNPNRLPSLA